MGDCRHGHRAAAGALASAPPRRRASGRAVERALRGDGHLLPGHHRAACPGDLPRKLRAWTGPSLGCRAARSTSRSSARRKRSTRAVGWTSLCSTCLMPPPGNGWRRGSPPRVPARSPRSTTGRPTAASPTRTPTGEKWCSRPGSISRQDPDRERARTARGAQTRVAEVASGYQMTWPPLTRRSTPVTNAAARLSRKMTGPTMSSGWAFRPRGVSWAYPSIASRCSGRWVIGV